MWHQEMELQKIKTKHSVSHHVNFFHDMGGFGSNAMLQRETGDAEGPLS